MCRDSVTTKGLLSAMLELRLDENILRVLHSPRNALKIATLHTHVQEKAQESVLVCMNCSRIDFDEENENAWKEIFNVEKEKKH